MERDIEPRVADTLGALVVDVREAAELDADGRVPGALHVPLAELSARAGELPADRPLAFLCRTGSRSAMAADAFRASGREAYSVSGGIEAWERDGLPVDRNT